MFGLNRCISPGSFLIDTLHRGRWRDIGGSTCRAGAKRNLPIAHGAAPFTRSCDRLGSVFPLLTEAGSCSAPGIRMLETGRARAAQCFTSQAGPPPYDILFTRRFLPMSKAVKYAERAVTLTAQGAWTVFEKLNSIRPNPSFTPKWSDKPLLKSYQKEKPPLGWPRTTDSLCP